VTPRPDPTPPILLGGSSAAAARRAARIADGWFPPLEPKLWPPYREECLRLGKPDPGAYPRHGPIFLWISEEPEKDWERLLPTCSTSSAPTKVDIGPGRDGPLRKDMSAGPCASPAYQCSPRAALALAAARPASVLYPNPCSRASTPVRGVLGLYGAGASYLPR
jgi:hypothetical protein